MSAPGELRVPVLPSGTRRRLVHGGFIAIALLYVGILVIAPLIGIAWAAFRAGWPTIVSTL
jgi:ABC-type sulfate transport system permease subunit